MSRRCITCKTEVENFNAHVKDVWHTYNLRRETAGLNPVSIEVFKAKQEELIIIAEPNKEYRCCSKIYKCKSTYDNHLKSKKHSEHASQNGKLDELNNEIDENEIETDEEYEEEDDLATGKEYEEEEEGRVEEPLTVNDCLLCNHKSKSLTDNLNHMLKKHEFAFPYDDFLVDEHGLMVYLIRLIDEFHVCLKCDKQFYDRLSVRNHMLDMNHGQINVHLENNADVLTEFYEVIPQPMSLNASNSDVAEVELPNGKLIGNRIALKYFKQNLNGLSNTNQLSITSGAEKANMSLMHLNRATKLAKPGLLTVAEKKQKSKEARYRQFRLSRYSNFQAHYRHQILM